MEKHRIAPDKKKKAATTFLNAGSKKAGTGVTLKGASKKAGTGGVTLKKKGASTFRGMTFTATDAKNSLGKVFGTVERGRRVLVTRHGEPAIVVMSFEDYQALTAAGEQVLDELTDEFDAMFSRMQGPEAKEAVDALFAAEPEELAAAAVAAASEGA